MKQQLYTATLYGGYCYLIKASSLEAANKQAMSESGSINVQGIRLANAEDIQWVTAMGGQVPELDPTLPSEWARKGFFVVEGSHMRIGAHIDFYDHTGCKRQGTVKAFDGKTIKIDGERKVIVEETFNIRYGR